MADKDFIENIFQRATEAFDIEFNPVAWERMQQKLSRARRRRKVFFWLWWSGLAMIILFVMWLLWRPFSAKELQPTQNSTMPVAEVPINSEEECPEVQEATTSSIALNDSDKEKVQKTTPQNLLQQANQNNHLTFLKAKKLAGIHKSKVATHPSYSGNEAQNHIATSDSIYTEQQTASSIFPAINASAIAGIDLKLLKSGINTDRQINVNQTLSEENNKTPVNVQRQNRWTLGILAAPEIASVTLSGKSDPGYSFGILTEYRLARRFSLSAQGLYASKRYTAGKGEFQPPKGAWYHNVAPIETVGSCNMLEATLSLRTELLQKQHWNLVANTGISTWWMLREGYEYHYEKYYPGLPYNWKSQKTLTQWLAIGQVGIGAERQVSSEMSIEADLYLQVPLQGIGSGKVQLYSQGISVALRRRF